MRPFWAKAATAFRLALPVQFTRLTKFCATCGGHLQWSEETRGLACPRCNGTSDARRSSQ